MKVILRADVKKLGTKGQIVDVTDGYANNYLIPKGLAEIANITNVNALKCKKESEARRQELEKNEALKLAADIEKITVIFSAKVGSNGKIFGAITSQDIVKKLKAEHNLEIDKKSICLEKPIKALCAQRVEVKLSHNVRGSLMVNVNQEGV